MFFGKIFTRLSVLIAGMSLWAMPTWAQDGRVGMAEPDQINFQQSATEIMDRITSLHDGLLILITVITIFVFALLGWVIIRYNRKANPTPSKTTHNLVLEVVWTIIPIFILVAIGVPSIRLLYFQDVIPEADVVIKATGHQWYWSYEYPDENGLSFDSIMLPTSYFDAEMSEETRADRDAAVADIQSLLALNEAPEIHRLLDTDTRVVVPVNKTVKLILTASDVIHAWTIPAFGVKVDAVPGRVNELWFNARDVGVYYGQCSELCGIRHAFMPIVVQVVSQEDYDAWVSRAQAYYAGIEFEGPTRLASAGAE